MNIQCLVILQYFDKKYCDIKQSNIAQIKCSMNDVCDEISVMHMTCDLHVIMRFTLPIKCVVIHTRMTTKNIRDIQ